MKKRLIGCACLALFAVTAVTAVTAGAADQRPNVILINVDNHHKGSLGFYGNEFIETPNIDRLFQEGLRFENYTCPGRCTSSRSALMTGRYHARNGSLGTGSAWGQMVEGVTTMGHVFSEGGYQTAHFGKWHMGDTYPLRPEDRGFQESLSIHNGGTLGFVVVKPGYNSSSRTAAAHRFRHNGEWKVYEGFRTDVWFSELGRYLSETRDPSKPFFVYLATVTAHGPCFGPKDLQDKYKAKFESPEFSELREAYEKSVKNKKPTKKGQAVSYPYDHAADIAGLDRNIGRLLDTLDELGLAENTIVVFASDGGGGGFSTLKGNDLKAGASGVPLVFRSPRLKNKPATSRQEVVANIDLLPTLADLCGLTLSEEHQADLDGQSMASLLDWSGAQPWKPRTYINDYQSQKRNKETNYLMMMVPHAGSTVQLPGGQSVSWIDGVTKSAEGPETVSLAQGAYERWLARVLEIFPVGAFGKVHSTSPTGFLAPYPILDGPAGEGILGYFLLDVAEDGWVEIDSNKGDQYGGERVIKPTGPVALSLSKKVKEGHLPVEFDKALNGYRVLPSTFKAFYSTEEQVVTLPAKIQLAKGRYMLHLHPEKGREPSGLRVAYQP